MSVFAHAIQLFQRNVTPPLVNHNPPVAKPRTKTIAELCLEILADGNATIAEIVNLTGKNSKRVLAALCELHAQGRVMQVAEIKRGFDAERTR